LCLRGNVDEAKRMMTKMRLNGLKDDVATHTSILKGLCIVGKFDEAIKHLKQMVTLGIKPDVKAFGGVVNEFCKMRKPEEAISLLKEMIARGLKPSVSSFNSMFGVLVENGDLEKVVLFLKLMPQMGRPPNFLSYTTVICSLCTMRGRMQEVGELVSDLLQNGHVMDATMYNCLIWGYCVDKNEQMTMRVFYEAIDKNYVISMESFSIFVKELCAKGKVIEAKRIFEDLCRKCSVLDVNSYRRVLEKHLSLYAENLWRIRDITDMIDHQHSSGVLHQNEYS
jgi:pentatricopeptide repeat protein